MSKAVLHDYLEAILPRYRKAPRHQKKLILDEFCKVCDIHRKHAIRLLCKKPRKPSRKVGRRPFYASTEFMTVLKRIWLASDQMCSKKLKSTIALWLPYYSETYGPVSPETAEQLLKVSSATIDRLLASTRLKHPKGLTGTKPGTLLRNQIPIRTHHWDISQPGYVEADTVALCGNSLDGDFVWTLTLTDILTAWTESRAVWNKGAEAVCNQIKNIEQYLPFLLLGFDTDNGSEFLNYHLVRYFANKDYDVAFTRGRPYHKNDNAHVEQKNWSHIRHLFGYDRFEKPELVPLMNDLLTNEWSLYQNFFCPTLKLKTKHKIGSRYIKHYETPRTPYQRIMESEQVPNEKKESLIRLASSLNPFQLKNAINRKLKAIFALVSVTSNVRQRI